MTSDVVFVLDKSTSAALEGIRRFAMLETLRDADQVKPDGEGAG